jgi:hypothetical protein
VTPDDEKAARMAVRLARFAAFGEALEIVAGFATSGAAQLIAQRIGELRSAAKPDERRPSKVPPTSSMIQKDLTQLKRGSFTPFARSQMGPHFKYAIAVARKGLPSRTASMTDADLEVDPFVEWVACLFGDFVVKHGHEPQPPFDPSGGAQNEREHGSRSEESPSALESRLQEDEGLSSLPTEPRRERAEEAARGQAQVASKGAIASPYTCDGLPSDAETCDCAHRYKRGACPFCPTNGATHK